MVDNTSRLFLTNLECIKQAVSMVEEHTRMQRLLLSRLAASGGQW